MNGNQPSAGVSIVPETSGSATTSLVLGILGFLTFGLTGIVAIIFGHRALSQIKKAEGRLTGQGIAIAGLVTGYLSLLLLLVAFGLGFAIFSLRGISAHAKLRQADADFHSFESALQMYKLNAGIYPTTEQGLGVLVKKPTASPLPRRWSQVMSKLNPDPWGSAYQYRFPSRENSEEPELSSKGPDGVAGTADDLTYQIR